MGDFTDRLTRKAKQALAYTLGGLEFKSAETPLEALNTLRASIGRELMARGQQRDLQTIDPFAAEPCASVVALAAAVEIDALRKRVEQLEQKLAPVADEHNEWVKRWDDARATPVRIQGQDTAREIPLEHEDQDVYFTSHGYYQAFRSGALIEGFRLRVMDQMIGEERFWRPYLYLRDSSSGDSSPVWDGARTRDRNRAEHEGARAGICFIERRPPLPRNPHEDDVERTHAERQAAVDALPPPTEAEKRAGKPPAEGA